MRTASLIALALLIALASIATMTRPAPGAPRLIGFGCGPDHQTMLAVEEDHFPIEGCERIEDITLYRETRPWKQ
jgi:hypothetical protein